MKKKLTNDELDGLGRELFRASMVPESKIEEIISSPMLFDSIKRRIEAERPLQKAGLFERWAGLPVLNWTRAATAVAAALIFIAATIVVFVSIRKNVPAPIEARAIKIETPVKTSAPPDIVQEPVTDVPPAGITEISSRKEPVKVRKTIVRHTPVRQEPPPRFEAEGDFYPVTFAGGVEDISGGGQVVRTEIPRSSLIAMGLDIPLESANQKIKTDLLVGQDGVIRGVRIVK